MKSNVYKVYDSKVEQYLPAFEAPTHGAAERSFAEAVNSQNHDFSKHPEDYSLHHVGTSDSVTGELEAHQIITVCTAIQVKKNGTDSSITPLNGVTQVQ